MVLVVSYGYILLFFFLFPLLSCNNEKEEHFNKYAAIKCAFEKNVAQRDSFVLTMINPLEQKLLRLEQKYDSFTEPYEYRIAELNNKLLENEDVYVKQYNKVSAEHEAKHGHMVTPEYERRIEAVEKVKQNALSIYNQQISQLIFQRDSSGEAKEMLSGIKELKQQLQHKRADVDQHFTSQLNNWQKELTFLDHQLDADQHKLSSNERSDFVIQREGLNSYPCNYIKKQH
jgi:hypothetical protein